MATFSGSDGVVKVGSAVIAETRSWSVDQTSDTNDDTVMGDSWRTHKVSLKSWTGSADVLFDDTDTTGQTACVIGTVISVSFQMEGDQSGDHRLYGSAIVTGKTVNTSYDGLVESSITFQGTGPLTEGTVSA